jgi:RNA recognition motif-containing protein
MFSRISNNSQQNHFGESGSVYNALTQLGPSLQQPTHAASLRGWPVTVSVEGIGFSYQLTNDDLFKVFSRYGVVTHVEVHMPEGNSATVCFAAYDEASRAIASLDGKELAGVKGHLRVAWGQLPTLTPGVHFGDHRSIADGQRKFTCRFEIGIENDKDFQVARRLIGQKGMSSQNALSCKFQVQT